MPRTRVAVIGAGMGGLAAAIDLAAAGMEVTLLERAPAPGGKMRQIEVDGQKIDAGPTVFTMRWVFESLFADAGASLDGAIRLQPAATLARHAWAGGATLDLFADRDRAADAIGTFAGAKDAAGYRSFCTQAARIYRTLEGPFIKSRRPSPAELVRAAGLFRASRLKPFQTLWAAVAAEFQDPRLRQLFARYSTYCGTSPYVAPATLMLVAHVEQEGVWYLDGGMHALAVAMAALAGSKGATVRYGVHVREITVGNGRVTGVRLDNGEQVATDAVVMNGEPSALAAGLLGPRVTGAAAAVKFPARSLSAMTWATVARTSGLEPLRHNVLFSGDSKQEFDLINAGRLPTEPTIYICAQDRTEAGAAAPDGPERLLMLVNAPATGDRRAFSQVEIDQCMQGITSLMQRCGMEAVPTQAPVMTGPAIFHRLFPGSGGALYGSAVIGSMATFKRPDSRTKVPGLYLAGGSTHPGAGVPMAALSGRLAAAAAIEDLVPAPRASINQFRRAATRGGTSTR